MAEKCTHQLPPLRVTEELEADLKRMAKADSRPFSAYLKLILKRHVDSHKASINEMQSDTKHCRA